MIFFVVLCIYPEASENVFEDICMVSGGGDELDLDEVWKQISENRFFDLNGVPREVGLSAFKILKVDENFIDRYMAWEQLQETCPY